METISKYNINKLGCFLKWVATNEANNKTKKNLVLSIIDNYYFQILLKDLPKIFGDVFLGVALSPTQKTALYNSFQNNPTYIEMRNVEDNSLILRTNSIFTQNNNLPNIADNTLIFDFDCNNTFIYNTPTQENTCVYLSLYFYIDSSAASLVGGSPRFERLLVSDIFDWVHFASELLLKEYFKNNKYLSVIEYNASNNAFGLVYEKVGFGSLDNTNKIRVPCYLDFPQFKNKEETYRNSEGVYVKINSISEKEWKLTTDYLSPQEHQTISFAFMHPNLKINEKPFFQSAGYEIKYSEEIGSITEAKAETKFIESPYNTQNPNFKF